jgi:hypothetical protein
LRGIENTVPVDSGAGGNHVRAQAEHERTEGMVAEYSGRSSLGTFPN